MTKSIDRIQDKIYHDMILPEESLEIRTKAREFSDRVVAPDELDARWRPRNIDRKAQFHANVLDSVGERPARVDPLLQVIYVRADFRSFQAVRGGAIGQEPSSRSTRPAEVSLADCRIDADENGARW